MIQGAWGEYVRSHHAEAERVDRPSHHSWSAYLRRHIVNLVANGMTPAQIGADLPELEEEDGRQALAYASLLAADERPALRT